MSRCLLVSQCILLHYLIVRASPAGSLTEAKYEPQQEKRQDDDTVDDSDGDDLTTNIRKGVSSPFQKSLSTPDSATAISARSLYLAQPSPTWYQIDPATDDSAASLTPFVVTQQHPAPTDPAQGTNFHVDHILEFQVIDISILRIRTFRSAGSCIIDHLVFAVNSANTHIRPSVASIDQAAWSSASSAFNTLGPSVTCAPLIQRSSHSITDTYCLTAYAQPLRRMSLFSVICRVFPTV